MNACSGKDVPIEIIENGLKDPDWRVRSAATKIAKERGISVPVYRSFEPPERVYKKCVGGVIVAAEIPQDAEVRGKPGQKCRASKAKIVEVFGDIFGVNVGVSLYDGSVWYFEGNEIEIDNFDPSDAECSRGYHFFCTREEAEDYNT